MAALDGFWGWWFPALILVTAGPVGALVGEGIIARRLARDAPAPGGRAGMAIAEGGAAATPDGWEGRE